MIPTTFRSSGEKIKIKMRFEKFGQLWNSFPPFWTNDFTEVQTSIPSQLRECQAILILKLLSLSGMAWCTCILFTYVLILCLVLLSLTLISCKKCRSPQPLNSCLNPLQFPTLYRTNQKARAPIWSRWPEANPEQNYWKESLVWIVEEERRERDEPKRGFHCGCWGGVWTSCGQKWIACSPCSSTRSFAPVHFNVLFFNLSRMWLFRGDLIRILTCGLCWQGVLDEQFLQLQQLQDESSPNFVSEVINIYFHESEKLLRNLRSLL